MSAVHNNSFLFASSVDQNESHQINDFLAALKHSSGKLEYKIWLSDLSLQVKEQNVVVTTSSDFKKEKIEERYWTTLVQLGQKYFPNLPVVLSVINKKNSPNSALNEIDKKKNKLNSDQGEKENVTNVDPKNSKTNANVLTSNKQEQQNINNRSNVNINNTNKVSTGLTRKILTENTLDNFIELPENQLALKFVKKSLERPGAINPIYLYGPVGVGKTHLLHAFANAFQKQAPFTQVEYLTPDDFVSDFTLALNTKTDRNFRIHYRSVDALLIDDIQFFMGKEKSSVEFFHVFNAIHASGKQMIFTSDRDPRELDYLDDRLKSRISSSAIIEIKTPAFASRTKLIDFYLKREKLALDEEVKNYLSERLTGDIRQLVGAIRYLGALASINQNHQTREAHKEIEQSIDISFCEEHLKQLPKKRFSWSKEEKTKVHPEKILGAVCAQSDISIRDLKAKKKSKYISRCRQITMYLLRNYTDLSFPEIGFSLGGRSTTTIIYGVDKITHILEQQQSNQKNELQKEIEEILNRAAELSVF